jgi:hypothetical protein
VPQKHPLYFAAASAVASGVVPSWTAAGSTAARPLSGAEARRAVGRLRTLLAAE